jgi:hypothetical protein
VRTVSATRYVAPLREGGSLPAIVEADDQGVYVLKFRGAGQGPKALIAELVAGELGRAAGLPVPEIVLIDLDPEMARTEPDSEIQALVRSSAGLNFGLDYLPGAVTYDPIADPVPAHLASRIVWFDALISNVDRTARNTNMLIWHRELRLIDHGAALYFHHAWNGSPEKATDPFPQIKNHVLLRLASELPQVSGEFIERLTPTVIERIVAEIPDLWLSETSDAGRSDERNAYLQYLTRRLMPPHEFVLEAQRARALLV